jgi:hypothetical protein
MRDGVGGVDRHVERDAHVRLRAEVVDLVRFTFAQDLGEQRAGVAQVAVVEEQRPPGSCGSSVDVVDAPVLNDDERRMMPWTS